MKYYIAIGTETMLKITKFVKKPPKPRMQFDPML